MKAPLKIFYLITKSNYGGAQKYVFELAVAAKKAGHTVVVGCGGTGEAGAELGSLATKLSAVEVPVYRIKHFMRNMSLINDVLSLVEVWRLLRREQPDVLHVTSSKAGGIGALSGRLAGIKRIIFTSHGLTVDETWRPRWQRILIYLGTWTTLRLAHHNIMISTETFNRARSLTGMKNRVSLIKNGIAPINFLERGAARAKLAPHVPPRSFWIGGIGELHPNKNWPAAILTMTTLPERTHLIIIGEGEERDKLQQLITQHELQNRVHLLGYVDGAPYLKAFDIFILLSKKEGLPYVIQEAGLAELPVVASDLPGNRDLINSGQTGILVEPTPNLIATSLSILVRDEGMRRRLGQALAKTVNEDFSINRMYTETFNSYESRISGA